MSCFCQESSTSFLVMLQSNLQHMMLYENPDLQQKARSLVPLQQLCSAAQHTLQEAQQADPGDPLGPLTPRCASVGVLTSFCLVGCKLRADDFLVLELLRWFKQDFFSWVDCLPCSRCGGPTQNAGSLTPSTDDLRWGAQRVEKHFCQGCQLSTRFPRCVWGAFH